MTQKIVIIGGVATGAKAGARIKRRDPQADVTILEQGKLVSYGACGLPYFIADVVKDHKELMSTPVGVIRDEGFFKKVKGVTVYTRTRAHEIDRENKTVKTVNAETGEEKAFSYDKLVLAVGGSPAVPPIEGVNLNNIFRLSTVEDGLAIKDFLTNGKADNAVIVGAGLIGMEMAESLEIWGPEITVIEMLDWALPGILDKEMGLMVGRYLESQGIRLLTSEKVTRFEGDDQGNVIKVVTDKRELDADMVLLSIGVRPNVALAQKAGLALGQTGAIVVNAYCQTSDPDIYAGGDCVETVHRLSGAKVYAPMGSTANKHGRIIADHITGEAEPFPGVLGTAICKVFDFNIGKTGLTEKDARSQGIEVETIICPGHDRPHFYPGRANIIVKLLAEKETGKLLGAQIVGPGDVAKRIEIAASSLSLGGTAAQIAYLDLAYAPPFSSAMDSIITAANVLENKRKGLAKGVSPLLVKEKLDREDVFLLLDVRSPQEYEAVRIEHPNVKLLPLGALRGECDNLPKDKEIITFCQFSLRGYEAQRILEAHGFTDVKFMEGGVVGWPFETVGSVW